MILLCLLRDCDGCKGAIEHRNIQWRCWETPLRTHQNGLHPWRTDGHTCEGHGIPLHTWPASILSQRNLRQTEVKGVLLNEKKKK